MNRWMSNGLMMNKWINGWINRWMDGTCNEWIDEWRMDSGWMD